MKNCIVVQAFVKLDTLRDLCGSLLKCQKIDEFNLVFWLDNPIGSRKEAEFQQKFALVKDFVEDFAKCNAAKFKSIETILNDTNLGTCKTCQVSIDYAMSKYDFVVFTEDDTIMSADTLVWFLAASGTDDFRSSRVWAIAGESIFFDGQSVQVSDEWVARAKLFAEARNLYNCYIELNFLPSTCFATTRSKWNEFSETRGLPCGDVDVCDRCRDEHKYAIFPIIARVKDVGMQHSDGYSVLIHSLENVTSVKSTYLTANDAPQNFNLDTPVPFKGSDGELWRRSVLLEGFEGPLS